MTETISAFVSQYWMYALIVAVVGIGGFLAWTYFKGKGSSQQKKQDWLMVMPEGQIVPMTLPIDYASSYTNCYMDVADVRRSWLMLPNFQRTVGLTKCTKIIADYRSLVPYDFGAPPETRKKQIEWAKTALSQIAIVQHDVTAFIGPKLEVKSRFQGTLITMALIGILGAIGIAVLIVVINKVG
jgi:hypothetical protein